MSDIFTIAKMTAGDIGAAYALHLGSSDDDPSGHVIEWLNETVDDPFGHFFVAYWGDDMVAYCGMYHNTPISNPEISSPDYCKIGDIVVKKEFQGKGIGKRLILKVLETAKELGVGRTKLEVETTNERAVKLYESLGFKIEETVEGFYDDGADAYIMWHHQEACSPRVHQ